MSQHDEDFQQANPESDAEFFAEVDAFIASMPEDHERIERIDSQMPKGFHQVLEERQRRALGESDLQPQPQSQPQFQLHADSKPTSAITAMPSNHSWNWSVIAASAAIAAGLIGLLSIVLIDEPDGPAPGTASTAKKPQPKKKSSGEFEFFVNFKASGEPEVVAVKIEPADSRIDPLEKDDPVEEIVSIPREPVLPVEDVASWFLRSPEAVEPPQVEDVDWPLNDIDRFILAKLEERGIAPSDDASPATRLHRLAYDLTGLPPSPALIEYDPSHITSPAAYRDVIEELLAKWQFGEHWSRHWLELTSYEESRTEIPDAWRYREYVIAAMNRDKPYDQFVIEQLSGDRLDIADPLARAEASIATGFLAMAGGDAQAQAAVMMRSFLGMSAPVEGGHKHPLSKRDYRGLLAIFSGTEVAEKMALKLDPKKYPAASMVEDQRVEAELKRLSGLISSGERRLERALERDEGGRVRRLRAEVADLRSERLMLAQSARDQIVSAGTSFAGVKEGGKQRPGRRVPGEMFEDLETPEIAGKSSGRRELAQWLVDERNPLTARVVVDRVWAELFGRGLVSGGDFGAPGSNPSHPELLDYLAVKFVEDGWSMKSLVRRIVSSRTYQLSSDPGELVAENPSGESRFQLYATRVPRQHDKLEIRDTVISIAGWNQPQGAVEGRMFARREFAAIPDLEDLRGFRTIYTAGAEAPDEETVFAAAVAASRRKLGSREIGSEIRPLVEQVFVELLGREPSKSEAAWAFNVLARGSSISSVGVLASSARPDLLDPAAAYLEGLLPRVTVQSSRKGGAVVPWAMLHYALMMSDEFRGQQ